MQRLTVAALFLDAVHHDVFGRHERQLVHQQLFRHLRIDGHAAHNVEIEIQNAVHREECLRDADAAVCRVVQRALKPLCRRRDRGVREIAHHIARKGGDALRAHGVTLVCHGGGADLTALKGLVHDFQVTQKADVIGKLCRALRHTAEDLQHLIIHLAGIGLTAHRVGGVKAHFFTDLLFERHDLRGVSVKERQEARARSGRALAAEELEVL